MRENILEIKIWPIFFKILLNNNLNSVKFINQYTADQYALLRIPTQIFITLFWKFFFCSCLFRARWATGKGTLSFILSYVSIFLSALIHSICNLNNCVKLKYKMKKVSFPLTATFFYWILQFSSLLALFLFMRIL